MHWRVCYVCRQQQRTAVKRKHYFISLQTHCLWAEPRPCCCLTLWPRRNELRRDAAAPHQAKQALWIRLFSLQSKGIRSPEHTGTVGHIWKKRWQRANRTAWLLLLTPWGISTFNDSRNTCGPHGCSRWRDNVVLVAGCPALPPKMSSKEGPKAHPLMFIHPRAAQAQVLLAARTALLWRVQKCYPQFHSTYWLSYWFAVVKVVQVFLFYFPHQLQFEMNLVSIILLTSWQAEALDLTCFSLGLWLM